MTATMQLIRQKGAHDCGVAALAMATGRTYDEILGLGDIRATIAANHGLNDMVIFYVLEALDFVSQKRFCVIFGNSEMPREAWPCPPFAPSHIAQVRANENYHYVATDAKGILFDPIGLKRELAEYRRVSWIAGLWPMPASDPSQ